VINESVPGEINMTLSFFHIYLNFKCYTKDRRHLARRVYDDHWIFSFVEKKTNYAGAGPY